MISHDMKKISLPIIFIGSGRSGTTIISEIIFSHEDLAWLSNYQEKWPSIPEVNLFRSVFENRLWRLQGQKRQLNKVSWLNKILFKPNEGYDFWEYITGPRIDFSRGFLINEKATEVEAKKIRKAFNKIVSYQSKKRLAFKITGPSRISYLQSIFPDAIFINVVRDPLPTIKSWINVEFWQTRGKHQLWWTGAYSNEEQEWALKNSDKSELLAALQYKKLMDVTAMEIKECNAKCLTIRYEEFVNHPLDIIENILDFTGLTKSKTVYDYLQRNKIYNQNNAGKKADTRLEKEHDDLDAILNGSYIFSEVELNKIAT